MTKCYVVTVQLLVAADNQAECADAVSETLRDINPEVIKDWSYLKLGGQYLSAGEEQHINFDDYEEGEAFGC